MQQINWYTLIPGMAGAVKLSLQAFGIDVPDEHINLGLNVVSVVLTFLAAILTHKKTGESVIPESVVQAAQKAPTTYQEMYPTIKNVHDSITQLYNDVRSGKVTDAVTNSYNIYLQIEELLKKKGA